MTLWEALVRPTNSFTALRNLNSLGNNNGGKAYQSLRSAVLTL